MEWKRAIRENQSIALIMIDVDFFKDYNDEHGHLAGDDCLKSTAKTIESVIRRPADFVARYGGEEFAVVLPETHFDDAIELANRMRSVIEDRKIPHGASLVSAYVTISLGVAATIPETRQDATTLIAAADKALYQAKSNGRNRVECSNA